MRLWRVLSVAVAVAAVLVTAAPAQAAGPQLRQHGRWLVDPQGRVVIVHGMNLVYKRAPYAPPASAAGFTRGDARWLSDRGFNGMRIGTLWAGVTPESSDQADPAYFAKWQRVIDLLARRRMWMLFDFHQDQWNEVYGGEGVPAWAVHRPVPYNLLPPVSAPFPEGYWTPELSTVFDNFWSNTDGLLDDWVSAWVDVASHWRHQPYSMGYDLLNEPWAGVEWPTCLTLGCPSTYPTELQPAFTKAMTAIRGVDPTGIVWFEPQQLAAGQPVGSSFAHVAGRNVGFSWHNYCPDVFFESQGLPAGNVDNCVGYSDGRNKEALRQSDAMDAAPLMTEFGATDNLKALGIDLRVADENLMGWTHWAYKRWDDPTTADDSQGLFTDDADRSTVKKAKVLLLSRTYPQATAGTPKALHFNPRTGNFRYVFSPKRNVTSPTRIFVSPLHYPHGYVVHVRHGRVTGHAAQHILLVRAAGSRPVTVSIRRR
jgi:endoglycosylceramidase